MAREAYKSTEALSKMTTRQLRQYISDKATEAQLRLDSLELDKAPRYLKEAAYEITNLSRTRVKRSTSLMTKAEMREYAESLRQFNILDTSSKYYKKAEYDENRHRYETFVKNRIKNDAKTPWAKYKLPSGRISKKGYEAYKQYVNFLKSVKDSSDQFGYETLEIYFEDATSKDKSGERALMVEKFLNQAFEESMGNGWTPKQLNDRFKFLLAEYDKKQASGEARRAQTAEGLKDLKKTASKIKSKPSKQSNSAKVPIKKASKLREHGKVRRTNR